MFRRVMSVLALALLIGGCVTTAQHTLPPTEVKSFNLTDVKVSIAPQASIVGYGIQEYAAARRIPNYELNAATETEEAKAWIRDHLSARVKAAMQNGLSGSLSGQRPVRAEVVVRTFFLSSAVQRIIVGGDYRIIADVTLVDAKSGVPIVSYPEMIYIMPALNGWGGAIIQAAYDASNPPEERLVNGFVEKYRDWLLKTS